MMIRLCSIAASWVCFMVPINTRAKNVELYEWLNSRLERHISLNAYTQRSHQASTSTRYAGLRRREAYEEEARTRNMDNIRQIYPPVNTRKHTDARPCRPIRVACDADDAEVCGGGEVFDCPRHPSSITHRPQLSIMWRVVQVESNNKVRRCGV